jgi:ribonuclease HI
MDPASVAGIIAATGQILRAIYQYGEGVLECKSEVSRLRAELYGINAALSQIEQDLAYSKADPKRSLASPNLASPESAGVLEEARNLLVPFASSLDAELSSARRLARKLVWPLKRHEVRVLGDHIERFKTYFILAATNDTLHAARGVAESLQDLHLSVKSLEILGDKRLLRTGVEKWLSAHDAKPAHESALAARVEDTNAWFVKGIFEDWASGESQLLWLKGKPGSGKTCILSACANKYT